jgi:hypothetical protein
LTSGTSATRKAEERYRIYEENYQREERALRNRVLGGLRAVARGEKVRLDPEAVEAAKKIMERQGVNNPGMSQQAPKIVEVWTTLIDDLSAEILKDAKAIQNRLDELLYPETLEDVEALKKQVGDDLEKVSRGEKSHLEPETLDAAKALNEIRERDTRRKREEEEAEALARRLEKEKDKKFRAAMDEMVRGSTRNILRSYGLPETTLDGMPPHEALIHIRFLRLRAKFQDLPVDERDERALQELEKELDQEHEERRRHAERGD